MVEANKIQIERKECGCNGLSCTYTFQPIDVREDRETGESNILRGILYCQYCTHTEECFYDGKKLREIEAQEKPNVI